MWVSGILWMGGWKAWGRVCAGQRGMFHLIFTGMTFLLVVTGFSLWGMLRHWRSVTATQLRLDRCVGRMARFFEKRINRLHSINEKMRILRGLVAVRPAERIAFQIALRSLASVQDFLKWDWERRRIQWILQPRCEGKQDQVWRIPSFSSIVRPIPSEDFFGKKLLQFPQQYSSALFFFEIQSGRCAAAACVLPISSSSEGDGGDLTTGWVGRGGIPFSSKRVSFWKSEWKSEWVMPSRLRKSWGRGLGFVWSEF